MDDFLTNRFSKSDIAQKYKISLRFLEQVINNYFLKESWLNTRATRKQIWTMSQDGFKVY